MVYYLDVAGKLMRMYLIAGKWVVKFDGGRYELRVASYA